jgi:hypothetical protein
MSGLRATPRPIWPVLPPVGTRVELRASSPWCTAVRPIPAGTPGEVVAWYGERDATGDHDARYNDFPLWVAFDGHPAPSGMPGRLCQPGELTVVGQP